MGALGTAGAELLTARPPQDGLAGTQHWPAGQRAKRFADTNWDFREESTADHVSSLHPYPARFIPALPRQAIRLLLDEPGVVWDPFAGSGTTLVEANSLGHRSVGLDVNHLGAFLQRVFTTPVATSDWGEIAGLSARLAEVSKFPTAAEIIERRLHIPRLTHWFSDGSIRAVGAFLAAVESLQSDIARDVAKLALSRVLVRISRQQSDTQYRAVKPDMEPVAAMDALRGSLRQSARLLPRFLSRLTHAPVVVRLGDSRNKSTFKGLPPPDLVVTSPPYPNSYEYWLYHKYRMFWLDMDPLWSRSNEIGARPFYSGSGKLGPEDFARDIRKVVQNITRVSTSETNQVWVVGDGQVKGATVATNNIVKEEAEAQGWKLLAETARVLRRARSSFQGIGRLKKEDILLFGALK